jgi:hypothetical protein
MEVICQLHASPALNSGAFLLGTLHRRPETRHGSCGGKSLLSLPGSEHGPSSPEPVSVATYVFPTLPALNFSLFSSMYVQSNATASHDGKLLLVVMLSAARSVRSPATCAAGRPQRKPKCLSAQWQIRLPCITLQWQEPE